MRELMIAAAVAVAAAGASGDVLFDNFGPGDSYALDTGWAISHGAILAGAVYEQAVAFTVTGGDYYFDSADLAVFNTIGPDLVHLDLRAMPAATSARCSNPRQPAASSPGSSMPNR